MKRKGELFRRSLIICVVLLLLANILLLGAYTYFGRKTFISLEQERLMGLADGAQELFRSPIRDHDNAFAEYLDAISLSNNTSYILIYSVADGFDMAVDSNISDYAYNAYLRQVAVSVINGSSIDSSKFALSDNESAICAGRPLYISGVEKPVGGLILVMGIDDVDYAFSRLNSSLWISALCLLPILLLTAYFSISQVSQPINEMTTVAKQLSKGNFDVRANEQYPGEIGILARTLNNMSGALTSTIQQLESEKRQLGYILSSFSEGVAAINNKGELTHYNPSLMKMFGTVDVHTPMDLVPDRAIWDAFDAVLDSKEPRTFHYNLPGDRVLWISIVPVLSESEGCVGAVGLFKDATDFERLDRMRNEYVANISHELRTPLTAIRGLLEPLNDGMVKDDEAKQHYYAIMLHEVERLSRLITDMLQLSRLQSGTESMDMTLFDVNELLDDVAQGYQSIAKKKSIRLEIDTVEGLADVMSDRDRIEQVLVILLDNALRYAKSTVRLLVKDDVRQVWISVWDDGCGINEKDRARLFERFYKVDQSRKEGGNGLGLSIAKQIMDKLDESLDVDSKEGAWTCFRLSIKKYVSNAIPLNSVQDIVLTSDDAVKQELPKNPKEDIEQDVPIDAAFVEEPPKPQKKPQEPKRRSKHS